MILDQPSQIIAMLRSGKMINIGGRPVIVPQARPASSQKKVKSDAIKLALAFVAIYVIWGSTYLAIRYAVETIPPLVTAGIRHSIAGGIMLAWAWWRGFRPRRQQWAAGFALGALFFLIGHGSLHWAEQYVGSGLAALLIATEPMFILVLGWMMGQKKPSPLSALGLGSWRGGRGHAHRRGTYSEGIEPVGIAGGAAGFFVVVVRRCDFAAAQAAFGCAGANRAANALRRVNAADRRRSYGRVPADTLGEHLVAVGVWSRLSDHVRISCGIHGLHLAAAAGSASAGGDAHVCESGGRSFAGMVFGARAFDHAGGAGVDCDSGSDCADPARGAGRGRQISRSGSASCRNSDVGMRLGATILDRSTFSAPEQFSRAGKNRALHHGPDDKMKVSPTSKILFPANHSWTIMILI